MRWYFDLMADFGFSFFFFPFPFFNSYLSLLRIYQVHIVSSSATLEESKKVNISTNRDWQELLWLLLPRTASQHGTGQFQRILRCDGTAGEWG